MEAVEILDIANEAIAVLLKISLPVMLVALGVGLVISLFQALTQIQEMTLSFVPKIVAIFVSLFFLMPYLLSVLQVFTESLFARIAGG